MYEGGLVGNTYIECRLRRVGPTASRDDIVPPTFVRDPDGVPRITGEGGLVERSYALGDIAERRTSLRLVAASGRTD